MKSETCQQNSKRSSSMSSRMENICVWGEAQVMESDARMIAATNLGPAKALTMGLVRCRNPRPMGVVMWDRLCRSRMGLAEGLNPLIVRTIVTLIGVHNSVIPAKAGIQYPLAFLVSGLRRSEKVSSFLRAHKDGCCIKRNVNITMRPPYMGLNQGPVLWAG